MKEAVFTGVRERWLPLYTQLKDAAEGRLGSFQVQESSSRILWKHSTTFAEIGARRDCLLLSLASDRLHEEWGAVKILQTSKNRVVHTFELTDDNGVDQLLDRLAAAHSLSHTKSQRPPAREFESVEEYIASHPPELREILQMIRTTIREAAPQAEEKISWQMPTYHQRENLVHFAAQKKHIGFYPSPSGIEAFGEKLACYKTTKGGVQFPLDQPIPYELISEITKYRVNTVVAP